MTALLDDSLLRAQPALRSSFEFSPTVAVSVELPSSHFMSPVHPNPVRGSARFDLSVARSQTVRIDLLDTTGRRVRTISKGLFDAGMTESVALTADGVPAGTYVLRVRGEYFAESELVVVVK